ncbi:hypothetical protein Tco_0869318 [Tanacetum coccineum]
MLPGTDNRPTNLVENDLQSWKDRNTQPHLGRSTTLSSMTKKTSSKWLISAEIHLSQGLPDTLQPTQSDKALQRRFWICGNLNARIRSTHLKAYEPHAKRPAQETGAVYNFHTNKPLRTSTNQDHATVHDGHNCVLNNTEESSRGEGHVARQCKEPKRKMDSQYFKDKALLMEAKEKGDVLDAEAEAFLADVECTAPYDQPQALTTTNMFQANHENAYGLRRGRQVPIAAICFHGQLDNPLVQPDSQDQ